MIRLACSDRRNNRWIVEVKSTRPCNVHAALPSLRIGKEWIQRVFEHETGLPNDEMGSWRVKVDLDQPSRVEQDFNNLMRSANRLSPEDFAMYVGLIDMFRQEVSGELGEHDEPTGDVASDTRVIAPPYQHRIAEVNRFRSISKDLTAPRQLATAVSTEDGYARLIRSRDGIDDLAWLRVKLSVGDGWSFAKDTRLLEHVGLGPIYSPAPASSTLDSVLVTALLLGITRGDVNAEEMVFGREFVDLLTHFWGPENGLKLESEASAAAGEVKRAFWTKYRAWLNDGETEHASISQMWRCITTMVPKLSTAQIIIEQCPSCETTKTQEVEVSFNRLQFSTSGGNRAEAVSGSTALKAVLSHVPNGGHCRTCRNPHVARKTWPNGPPAVISLAPQRGMRIAEGPGNMQSFDVDYHWRSALNKKVQTSSVRYQWLGGIYTNSRHSRVYFRKWRFGGEGGKDLLTLYDGTQLRGAIVGDVDPQRAEEMVPEEWQMPAVALFERVG